MTLDPPARAAADGLGARRAARRRHACASPTCTRPRACRSRRPPRCCAPPRHAVEWSGGDPLVFGGDINLRPARNPAPFAELRERFGLGDPTGPHAIDHLLVARPRGGGDAAAAAAGGARAARAGRPAAPALRPCAGHRGAIRGEIVPFGGRVHTQVRGTRGGARWRSVEAAEVGRRAKRSSAVEQRSSSEPSRRRRSASAAARARSSSSSSRSASKRKAAAKKGGQARGRQQKARKAAKTTARDRRAAAHAAPASRPRPSPSSARRFART